MRQGRLGQGQGGPSFKRVINYLCELGGGGEAEQEGGAPCVSELSALRLGPARESCLEKIWPRPAPARAESGGGEWREREARYVARGRGKGCLGRNLIRGGPGLFCTHCISLTPLNYAVNNIHGGVDCTKIIHPEHS